MTGILEHARADYRVQVPYIDMISTIAGFHIFLSYIGSRSLEKRLKEIIDEETVLPQDKTLLGYKILAILSVALLIGVFYWKLTLPTFNTHSEYGIWFEYNKSWKLEKSGVLQENADETQGYFQISNELNSVISLGYVNQEEGMVFDPTSTIYSSFKNAENSLIEREIDYSFDLNEIISINVNGHEAWFCDCYVSWSDNNRYVALYCFYCDDSNRIFHVTYVTENMDYQEYHMGFVEKLSCH